MLRSGVFAAAAAFAAASAAGSAAAAPLSAYAQMPSIDTAAVSPDGGEVAIISTEGGAQRILIEQMADHKVLRLLNAGDIEIHDAQWAGDKHLILTLSRNPVPADPLAPRFDYSGASDYDLDTQKIRPFIQSGEFNGSGKLSASPMIRTADGRPAVFLTYTYYGVGPEEVGVYRASLETDKTQLVEPGGEHTYQWVLGADGAAVGRGDYAVDKDRIIVLQRAGAGWRPVIDGANGQIWLLGLGRDGRSLLVRELVGGAYSLREVSAGAPPSAPLTPRGDETPIFDPQTQSLIGFHMLVGDEQRYTFFDPRDQKAWSTLQAAFPNQRVQLISWSADRRRLVLQADSPAEGPAYVTVDMSTGKASWLGTVYDQITAADVAPVQPVRFTASDGLAMSGYLTLPRGAPAKGLPLVVLAHDGPVLRDTPGFDWWSQALASRGYAVLRVNFRGSFGYGADFRQAGVGEWGRKMQTDLSDGVKHLVDAGVVDPRRVCIAGKGYGGYAALQGVASQPGVYRCAIAVDGQADLGRFIDWSNNTYGKAMVNYWLKFTGAADANDPRLKAISPALHADRVAAPVLLIDGKRDMTVPPEQSRMMADALRKAGKPAELAEFDADHWLSTSASRLQMLEAMTAFLEKNNPPN